MRTELLGVRFDDLTIAQAVEKAAGMMTEGGFHYAVTPNAEFVQRAERDEKFRCALNGADLVLPDGIGVVYSAKILGTPLKERVPGIEFATDMLACTMMGPMALGRIRRVMITQLLLSQALAA